MKQVFNTKTKSMAVQEQQENADKLSEFLRPSQKSQSYLKSLDQSKNNRLLFKKKSNAPRQEDLKHQEKLFSQIFNQEQKKFSSNQACINLIQSQCHSFKSGNIQTTQNIKTFARFRPISQQEDEYMQKSERENIVQYLNYQTIKINENEGQNYVLDEVFDSETKQEYIYQQVAKQTIIEILKGFNGTIFAYGQTGSGKTYTMYGNLEDEEKMGIIPRAALDVFHHINENQEQIDYVIDCSMLEIYKEKINDLIDICKMDLTVKEHPYKGIYVEGLSKMSISSQEELLEVLDLGASNKTTKATRMNEYSSRSHTLFMLEISQKLFNEEELKGKLNLIDLAGSEKISKSGVSGDTLEEAKKINLSLSCLGNVIHALTAKNADYIPYRDSKLTRILKESLSGNFKTSIIVTCSPSKNQLEETISTLKFASRAKTIKTSVKINIS